MKPEWTLAWYPLEGRWQKVSRWVEEIPSPWRSERWTGRPVRWNSERKGKECTKHALNFAVECLSAMHSMHSIWIGVACIETDIHQIWVFETVPYGISYLFGVNGSIAVKSVNYQLHLCSAKQVFLNRGARCKDVQRSFEQLEAWSKLH